jgi:hypothetical protein
MAKLKHILAAYGLRDRYEPRRGSAPRCRGLELAKLPFEIAAIPEQHVVEEFSALGK